MQIIQRPSPYRSEHYFDPGPSRHAVNVGTAVVCIHHISSQNFVKSNNGVRRHTHKSKRFRIRHAQNEDT
jgi:hypothetical protein